MTTGRAVALSRDQILRSLASFVGATTSNGNIGGTTLICSSLIGSNDFITDKAIIIESGNSIYEDSSASVFDPVTGQITVNVAFSGQILVGTTFFVLNSLSPRGILALIAGILGPSGMYQGLSYYGVVTAVPVPGQFTIPTLAGLGANKFIDTSLVSQYQAFVLRDASGPGAPPQGESRPITGYATLTGNFSANVFTAAVAVGDEILIIHPFLARIMNLVGMPGTNGNLAGNWQAAETTIVTIGAALLRIKIHNLTIGIAALAGNITIRMYTDVNGVQRRIFPIPAATTFSVAGDAPAIPVINGTMGFRNAVRITAQSDAVADNGRIIEYDYLVEAM